MAGVAAGGPSAKTANPQVLPGGLATPGVHIHRWYEARSHHGGSRFDDRGIVRREHQQRSAHASAHAEKGARVAAALYRSDCQTRRGTGAGRVDRAVDGAAAAGGYRGLASYRERQEVACGLGAVSNGAVDHAGFRSSSRRDLPHALGKHPLGQRLIFNPRGKSRKHRRYVPLTERVNVALVARKEGVNEGWVFPSKRAQSGYITDREVSKQWLEAKGLAGVPESVVLYCARHRFSNDAMEGTGNVMAVMDAMGHGSVNTTRIYTHSNVRQIREAIERRNQLSTKPVEAVQKLATKVATVA